MTIFRAMMRRVLFVLAAAAVLCVLSVVGGVRGEGLSLHTAPFRLDGGMEEHWVQGRESRGLLKDEHRVHPHRVETQTLYVALKVRRFEELDALFWDVSNPKSEAYGQYKTIEELADLVAPEMEDAGKCERARQRRRCAHPSGGRKKTQR